MYEARIVHHQAGAVFDGLLQRRAVRALVYRDGKLLMIHSRARGDYKFPGGGVEAGESDQEALIREVGEESGYGLSFVGRQEIRMIEESASQESESTLFRMTSDYFICALGETQGPQKLDDYEADLGFQPAWITIGDALAENMRILAGDLNQRPPWLKREIHVLEFLSREGLRILDAGAEPLPRGSSPRAPSSPRV